MSTLSDCPHRPPCPGCPRLGESGPPQNGRDIAAQLAGAAGLAPPPLHTFPSAGYRHRARLAVRGRARSPKIGLFQAASHRIADTPRCPVHHASINWAAEQLRSAIRETGTEPYADRPHRGQLRYVQFVAQRETNRVQVVLVANGPNPETLGALPKVLERNMGARLQGLFVNAQPERSNSILGPKTFHLAGEPMLPERFGDADVFFPPDAFGQNHLPLFDLAVRRIHALVPRNEIVAEIYCGVGAIGLGLLDSSREVRFNERSPGGLAGLEAGLAASPARDRASVWAGSAGERLDALAGADCVIVDPPRRGLDAPLLTALRDAPPRRLIYLACGQDALVRDLAALVEHGSMRLSGIELFDFFPFTEHVETLVWLDRTQ